MWLSIHAAFTEEGGKEGGGGGRRRRRRRDDGLRGREVVFLLSLAQGKGKTIGVQMDASPLFLDEPPLTPPSHPFILSSILSLHPSFLPSQDIEKEGHNGEEGYWLSICVKSEQIKQGRVYLVGVCLYCLCFI